jgi:hypothetical protein
MSAPKQVRRSVTLPAQVAKQVESMAKRRRLSDNCVLVELIEEGIEARKQKERISLSWRSASVPLRIPKKLSDWGMN